MHILPNIRSLIIVLADIAQREHHLVLTTGMRAAGPPRSRATEASFWSPYTVMAEWRGDVCTVGPRRLIIVTGGTHHNHRSVGRGEMADVGEGWGSVGEGAKCFTWPCRDDLYLQRSSEMTLDP